MNKNIDMTVGKPISCITKFMLPLLAGNILQQLYVFFDTMIVGNYVGINGLAALGATEWLIFMIVSGAQGITHGFSIDMAQSIGKKDEIELRKCIAQSTVLSIIISLFITIIGINFSKYILLYMNTPEEIVTLSCQYINIIYFGLIISVFYNLAAAILRAFGDSVTPLKALIRASAINIILDYIFVACLNLGVRGAASATIIAQAFSFVYCLNKLSKNSILHFTYQDFKIDYKKCWNLLKLGIPLGMQNVIIGAGGVVVQTIINGYGTVFIAAYTAANKLYVLLEIGASSLGSAMATYMGQNIGAGDINRVRKGMKVSILLSITVAYIMSLIMLVFGKIILACFISAEVTVEISAIAIGYQFLIVLSIFFPLLYVLYVLYAGVQGMRYTFLSMISSIAQLVMRILCAIFLTRIIGYYGFFWGEIFAWIGSDIILLIAYFSGVKKIQIKLKSHGLCNT